MFCSRLAFWTCNLVCVAGFLFLIACSSTLVAQENVDKLKPHVEPVHFSRDVLPILSDRCFHCHGPDDKERKAGLRLDDRDSALDVIEVGAPEESELWLRIQSDDSSELMPPPNSHRKPLTKSEAELIRRWITEGAEWGKHWSFEPISRPKVPSDIPNPIDYFIKKRLDAQGLRFSDRAEPTTLARRISFDLRGLPPEQNQLEELKRNPGPKGLAEFIDRQFQSKHHGERMAMWWLDAARYSDTDGYQQDAERTNWPWRDWVIDSFNQNKPFDQFTLEQFAGDLLPNASPEQKLATCFHRNHMANGEGGRHAEESRIDYVIDRINTTGTVWLGLTLGCCQCHSHKFDPISQAEYYSLFAFFNSIEEDGRAGGAAKPFMKYQSRYAKINLSQFERSLQIREAELKRTSELAEARFKAWLSEKHRTTRNGFEPWRALKTSKIQSKEGTRFRVENDSEIQTFGPNPRNDDYRVVGTVPLKKVTGIRIEIIPNESHTEGKHSRGDNGEIFLTSLKVQIQKKGQSQLREIQIQSGVGSMLQKPRGDKKPYPGKVNDVLNDDPRNGWFIGSNVATRTNFAIYAFKQPIPLSGDEQVVVDLIQRFSKGGGNIGRFRISLTDQAGPAVRSLEPMPLQQLAQQQLSNIELIKKPLRQKLRQQFLADDQPYLDSLAQRDRARRQWNAAKKSAGQVSVMVLKERNKPRATHVLKRGVWDQKGKIVTRRIPSALGDVDIDAESTRLDFAKWIVSKENPLTARVIANQMWQLCFGVGLVRTPEDFGLQGQFPTHPELLDWLAAELIESGWDLQHLLKLILSSQTYCQKSHWRDNLREKDPENLYFARASRFRLPSWMLRDAALYSGGLLNSSIGGPPVKPYQPPGIWNDMFMGRLTYVPSEGTMQHRRTLYSFWRRTAAPTFLFDVSKRRVCEVRPRRTNTPLHALTLLNDVGFLESARELAKLSVSKNESTEQRLSFVFQKILSRPPNGDELKVLKKQFQQAQEYYSQNVAAAKTFLDFGQLENQVDSDWSEIAAYTVIASMVFNTDEALTRE